MFRPELDDEVKEQVEALTASDFNVKESKVSFNDRLRVLVEKQRELQTGPFTR
jgi:hypothetical protein